MPDQPDDTARLRAANYALEDLPETIAFPQRPGGEPREPLPVVEAIIDDIAFAIVAAEQESLAAYARAAALQRLYKLARVSASRHARCPDPVAGVAFPL